LVGQKTGNGRHFGRSDGFYAEAVSNRATAHRDAIESAATAAQCWRLNQLGLLELRDEPGKPLARDVVKELLAEAVRRGLWAPEPREGKS
jgi:hypothetical protein